MVMEKIGCCHSYSIRTSFAINFSANLVLIMWQCITINNITYIIANAAILVHKIFSLCLKFVVYFHHIYNQSSYFMVFSSSFRYFTNSRFFFICYHRLKDWCWFKFSVLFKHDEIILLKAKLKLSIQMLNVQIFQWINNATSYCRQGVGRS